MRLRTGTQSDRPALKQEQVLTPINYYFQKYGVALTGLDTTRPYDWSDTTIAKMLEDEIYLGHTISLRYTTPSYKNKKKIERPESEWLRFENTHEPLITPEIWELVREVRKHKRRPAKKIETPNLFSGLVYCADCGKPMRLHRTRTKAADSYNNFKCSTYSNRGKEACSGHYIRESQLRAIVLDDLRRVTQFARQKETLLLQPCGEAKLYPGEEGDQPNPAETGQAAPQGDRTGCPFQAAL